MLSVLPRRPREFFDRVSTIVEYRLDRRRPKGPDYDLRGWEEVVAESSRLFSEDAERLLAEPELARVERVVRQRLADHRERSSIPRIHDGGFAFARLCYVACRLARPENVVETGVAHGVSTAFILEALRVNGRGRLFSIDLPPLRGHEAGSVGAAVPEDLRDRWELLTGATRLVLPRLMRRLDGVGVFVHDSLHTYRTMRMEFDTIWPRLGAEAVVIADDIEGNGAFADFVAAHPPDYVAAIAQPEKEGAACGVAAWRRGQGVPTADG